MMRLATAVCLALICTGVQADAIDIYDSETIESLRKVHNALRAVSRAVTACANDGGDRQTCVCMHENLVSEFHDTVKTLLREHPEISEYGTVNFKSEDGGTIAQNIPAMIRQVENQPDCP